MNRTKVILLASAVCALSPIVAGQALAQGAAAPKADTFSLDEVVVTAQRRQESAQDVPITVTAVTADQAQKAGLTNTADLSRVVPGVSVNSTGARLQATIRGVGSNSFIGTPTVLTFIDGVYQPFDTVTAFNNIQTIEVAKGPQGTLFGRNASGGIIQITTRDPRDWQGLEVQAGYASYETVSAKLYGAAKLTDQFYVDIAAYYEDQGKGWGTNLFDGSDFYKDSGEGVRLKAVGEIDDSFTVTVTADTVSRSVQTGLAVTPAIGYGSFFSQALNRRFFVGPFDVAVDSPPFVKTKESGAAVTLEKMFGDIKLLSISSYREWKNNLHVDTDSSPVPFSTLSRVDRQKAWSQELQLSGSGEKFSWVTGLYYYNNRTKSAGPIFRGILPTVAFGTPPGVPFAISTADTTDASAVYAQGTLEVLPETNLTVGARYTVEKRTMRGSSTGSPFLSPRSAGSQSKTFEEPNFRVALDHNFTPEILGYVSYTKSFNAGFFNQLSVAGFNDIVNPAVLPENIDAYEAGIKSDFFDNRLRVNVAAYIYDYRNLQQQIFNLGQIRTVNAASARIEGVDVDIVARPIRELTLSVSGSYVDARYSSYPNAVNYIIAANGDLQVAPPGAADASGKRLIAVPKFSAQFAATYSFETSFGAIDVTGTVNYQDKFYADALNRFPLVDRTLVGLNGQWTSTGGDISVSVWGKNLTDEAYNFQSSVQEHTGVIGYPGAPRTYGVTVLKKF